MNPEAGRVLAELAVEQRHLAVLTALAELGPPADPVRLPPPAQAAELLERLGVGATEVSEALDARPDDVAHPALWWLLERCHHRLVREMGRPGELGPWPELPAVHGATGRYLYVWVLLSALPFVRRYHSDRGIPDRTSWEILAALGPQMSNYRALRGLGGLHTHDWMTVHFRGLLYALGRLYYERLPIWFDAGEPTGGGRPPRRNDWALGLHIPEGRLTPESCDDSLARAAAFFPKHFADENHRYAVCTSWVLDPQLTEYLPPSSNIIRFQHRFTLLPAGDGDNNATVVEFLFRRPLAELAQLPQQTTLQRAVVQHIRAGRNWQFRTGWFAL